MSVQTIPQVPGTETAAVAVFASHEAAGAAVKALAAAGFDIKKISVVGRGFHTEENVSGFYNAGDRIRIWGRSGAFWGGLWGLLMGGLFMTVPIIGPVVVVGHFAVMVAAAIEGAVVIGGLSALGAALFSMGIPKDTIVRYENAIKADGFLLIVHGPASETESARAILANAGPSQLDMHNGITMTTAAVKSL
jgi:hypothetical protein